MPYRGIETGRPHFEDTSLARDFVIRARDKKGNPFIYDLAPSPQIPEPQRRGLIGTLRQGLATAIGATKL
ncbi:MAG: hypothetical protein AAB801_01660 [Patescibacteria group bacterium]